jgi:phage-Barnase-EndoU-ColicinE5/D-RelE like nuclease3
MSRAIEAAKRMWDHHGHQIHTFGTISDVEASRIKQETGICLNGFTRFMATRGVRHVKKNHADLERETAQQQFPVKPSDFALIPNIAATGSMRLIGKTGSRKPARLEYKAIIDNRVYIYLETIGIRDKRLELWTMRIEQMNKRKV